MKIFTGNSNPQFAEGISQYLGMPLGKVDLRKFSDGELYVVRVSGSVNLATQRELSYMANVERVFNETKCWFD